MLSTPDPFSQPSFFPTRPNNSSSCYVSVSAYFYFQDHAFANIGAAAQARCALQEHVLTFSKSSSSFDVRPRMASCASFATYTPARAISGGRSEYRGECEQTGEALYSHVRPNFPLPSPDSELAYEPVATIDSNSARPSKARTAILRCPIPSLFPPKQVRINFFTPNTRSRLVSRHLTKPI